MIGKIPNVYEALYFESLLKRKKIITNEVFNKGKIEAFNLGMASQLPITVETTIDKDITKGSIFPLKFQKDIPQLFENQFNLKKFPKSVNVDVKGTEYKIDKIDESGISRILNHKSNPFSFKKDNVKYTISKKETTPSKEINKNLLFGDLDK